MFDINLFIFPTAGTGKPLYPGFLVMMPPKKPARGRENDLLILYFKLYGKSSITDAGLKTWLENKAAAYYRSSGTVTSGIRGIFDEINEDLLDRNSRFAKQNGQINASMQVMVQKKEQIYLAICGAGMGFLISKDDAEQTVDDENGSRGLGVAQTISLRFNQRALTPGDAVLFTIEPPSTWTRELMVGGQRLSNEALYRRLFSPGVGDAQGVLIRFREGSGKITMLKPHLSEPTVEGITQTAASEGEQGPVAVPVNEKEKPISEHPQWEIPQPTPKIQMPNPVEGKPQLVITPRISGARPQQTAEPVKTEPVKPQSEQTSTMPSSSEVKAVVGSALRKGVEVKSKTETWVKNFLQKIIPGPSDQPLRFPRTVLIGIAVIVPIIIVAIAATLYVKNGRNSLFEGYMAQAVQLSQRADSQQADKALRLASLQESLYWLDKADQYGKSDQSSQLRNQVQNQLDEIQGITRIDMIRAVNTSLPVGTSITQLAASGTDLYALDSESGTVLRFTQSGSEFVQDTAFDCGPNPNSPMAVIGKLVDMVPISPNNTYGASLLAIDSQGKLDYCVPGEAGYVVTLTPPDMGWVGISSISLNQSNLYVLDVRGNAVYRYEGSGNQFPDAPTLFFDEVIPSLTQAIDIEVVGYELYILRSNGELVECTYSPLKDMKSTECIDPASYNDSRTGTTAKTNTFSNASFVQMHMTLPPDSSLYFLDTTGKAIYHLSYARNLQGILYPRLTDGENIDKYNPSAFFVSPARQVFMAFGSLIYYGQMP